VRLARLSRNPRTNPVDSTLIFSANKQIDAVSQDASSIPYDLLAALASLIDASKATARGNAHELRVNAASAQKSCAGSNPWNCNRLRFRSRRLLHGYPFIQLSLAAKPRKAHRSEAESKRGRFPGPQLIAELRFEIFLARHRPMPVGPWPRAAGMQKPRQVGMRLSPAGASDPACRGQEREPPRA
jgi:hypothetical protein